jgi:hypothetical protein
MTDSDIPGNSKSGRTAAPVGVAALALTSLLTAACGSFSSVTQHPSVTYRNVDSHLSEELRASIKTVAIRPNSRRTTLYIEGDYEKAVPTSGEGAKTGAGAGLRFTGEMISEDARSLIIAPIILPVALIVGSIGGAAAAKIQKEIQEFRDDLTAKLTEESNPPLGGDILAAALHSRLEKSRDIETILIAANTPVPAGADAIVDIRVSDLTMVVEKSDAIMITTAVAELRLTENDPAVFYKSLSFSDRDSLSNWVKDENALWTNYVERATQHFTKTIRDEFFEEIYLRHVLRPTKSDSSSRSEKRLWSEIVKTATPTFTWELILLGGDAYGAWTEDIDAASATYELEIYDDGNLVYAANNLPTPYHEVQRELEVCKTYSWSVRPHYQIDGMTRTGEWMKYASRSAGVFRSHRSETPEFWSNYPELKIRC